MAILVKCGIMGGHSGYFSLGLGKVKGHVSLIDCGTIWAELIKETRKLQFVSLICFVLRIL